MDPNDVTCASLPKCEYELESQKLHPVIGGFSICWTYVAEYGGV